MRKRCSIILLALLSAGIPASACTAFCASNRRSVLVGNNEDDNNPFTSLWFVPGAKESFGRLYVGYDNFEPQGGMNEKGLWFDAFATAPIEATTSLEKPVYPRSLVDKAMAECASVEDVIRLYERYNRAFMKPFVLMFADASGDSVIIEPNAFVRKKGRFQVQTNFHQSLPVPEYQCPRFATAMAMLASAGDEISVKLFRRILAATHSEETYPTVYSNIYDLKRRVMYLYNFHNFRDVVTIDLRAELKKGIHSVAIPTLFPKTPVATAYLEKRARELKRVEPPVVKVDPKSFDDYAGSYRLENGVHFLIVRQGGRLMLDADPLGRVVMYPESPTKFFLRITNSQVTFIRGADGKVNEVSAFVNGSESRGARVR
jgi:hypothetical protein